MCQCQLCVLCVFVACFCVYTVTTFNVESFNYATYDEPNPDGHPSMFGFSMALHRERNLGWLIVGAPEAQTRQPGVSHGGAVYKCPTDRDGGCEEILFDTKGHNRDLHNSVVDNKTEQWFGATVSSSARAEGPIVACAPRYTWYPRGRTRRDPVGTCYVSNGQFRDFNEYSPCRTYQWGYHRQGSCQAGFSAAINSAGDRLFIGSPGSWYWQGQMYSIDAHATFDFKPSLFSATYGHEGQVHQQSLETRPAVFSTTEGSEEDDVSYMGYSTIVGDFLGNGQDGIAVGMPRGNNLTGKVLLFTWNLTNFLHHFTGDQIGSYYGYALAASDVDGDGKLDLIVGAPMYTVQNNEDKYDVGRVCVIYHESKDVHGKFKKTYNIDGFNSKSRFGQALASLGDINRDGYGDFAVGAPYDGEDNRGAVYIYHGSSKGIRKKFSQVIFAADVIAEPSGVLTTFGFAITGGIDLDGNEYPDMAVGAYLSNKAFFFRSRPVISVEASVTFLNDGKAVDITNPNHVLRTLDNMEATKTQIQFCSRYFGEGAPTSFNLGVEYSLDTKKLINPRMGFVDDEGQHKKNATVTLRKNATLKCEPPIDVYVKSDIRDKLTSLVVEAKYWMQEDADLRPSYLVQRPRNPRAPLTPVLDLNTPPSKKASISIKKNCGNDSVCVPNLGLSVTPSVQQYLLHSGEKLFLDIVVSNTGEDAFEATLEIKYPEGLFYGTSQDIQVVSHVLCSSAENFTIKCDIGNPIPFNKIVHFSMSWQPDYSKEFPAKLSFNVTVNSTNEEHPDTMDNNNKTIEISILNDVIQNIRGWSIPNEVLFSSASSLYAADFSNQTHWTDSESRLSEDVIGPQVIHVYQLKNGGKTSVKATEIFFVWPATTSSGEDFLYLVDPPHFSSTENLNLKCGPIPANYRDFEVSSRKKSIWELYDIDISSESSTQKIISTKNETSTQHKIGSTVGGTLVKGEDAIDKAVEKSGDSSDVMDVRHNKTQVWESATRVQIFEGGDTVSARLGSGSFKHMNVDGRDYVYRCFRTDNGKEEEVDCGADFSFSGVNIPGLLQQVSAQYQEEGDIRYSCLQPDGEGNWKQTACGGVPKIPITVSQEGKTTVQIFNGGGDITSRLVGGKYQHEKSEAGDLVYRCFRRINGRQEEIDCGRNFTFSSIDIPWLMRESGIQQEGNIQYACLEPDSNGNLTPAECENVPKVRVRTEIIKTFWGSNDTHYWNNTGVYFTGQKQDFTRVQVFQGDEAVRRQLEGGIYRYQHADGADFIYRCFRRNNGREEEVDCGENFSLAYINLAELLQRTGTQQEGNIRYTCLEPNSLGNLRSADCAGVPKIRFKTEYIRTYWHSNGTHYWNNTGVYTIAQRYSFTIVQVLQGGQEVARELSGTYRLETIEGQNFLYRCFENQRQVDCGPRFSLAGINVLVLLRRVAISQEEHIRYFCLEMDSAGNWRGADCGRLPKLEIHRARKTFETQQQILRRCLKLVNGQWMDVDCRTEPRLQTGGREHTFVEECYQTVDGRREKIDCSAVPAGSTFDYVHNSARNQQSQGGSNYYNHQSERNPYPHQSSTQTNQYGQDYNTNHAYGRTNGYGANQSYNFEESYEFEDEDEDGRAISGHNPAQGRPDSNAYGTFGQAQGTENSGLAEAAQGREFTAVALDLGNLGQGQGNRRTAETHWSETHHVAPVYNNIERDNVPTDAPSSKNWHHGRRKRQIIEDSHPSIEDIRKAYPCDNLGCIYMRCTIENFEQDKPLTIALRGRLNARVLRNMKLDNAMQFSSMMVARVHKAPHLISPTDTQPAVQEVETVVKEPEEIKSETVPLWVVVLSAVAGTIILLLIIFLLYKLGFFKRNRPSSAPERQPLNRNGYHHGDEAL